MVFKWLLFCTYQQDQGARCRRCQVCGRRRLGAAVMYHSIEEGGGAHRGSISRPISLFKCAVRGPTVRGRRVSSGRTLFWKTPVSFDCLVPDAMCIHDRGNAQEQGFFSSGSFFYLCKQWCRYPSIFCPHNQRERRRVFFSKTRKGVVFRRRLETMA